MCMQRIIILLKHYLRILTNDLYMWCKSVLLNTVHGYNSLNGLTFNQNMPCHPPKNSIISQLLNWNWKFTGHSSPLQVQTGRTNTTTNYSVSTHTYVSIVLSQSWKQPWTHSLRTKNKVWAFLIKCCDDLFAIISTIIVNLRILGSRLTPCLCGTMALLTWRAFNELINLSCTSSRG